MQAPDFWKTHYVTATDAGAVEAALSRDSFRSGGEDLELVHLSAVADAPCILISQGSGGHAYVFAELAYQLSLAGFGVFIMPKHGGRTVSQLLTRHLDALEHIGRQGSRPVGLYGEGLGGYVAFYLALAHAPIASLVCENSPAVLNEPAYHDALLADGGPWTRAVRRRRRMLPLLRPLTRLAPGLPVPLSSYLPWQDLIDTRPGSQATERRLVVDGYLRDRDFDRWYPLAAVMSLLSTPPPGRLEELATPTMFVVASDGPTHGYIRDLYGRLPTAVPRRLVPVDGSVYWMLSHPRAAAGLLAAWFSQTMGEVT